MKAWEAINHTSGKPDYLASRFSVGPYHYKYVNIDGRYRYRKDIALGIATQLFETFKRVEEVIGAFVPEIM